MPSPIRSRAAMLAATILVAACGGSGGTPATPAPATPAPATPAPTEVPAPTDAPATAAPTEAPAALVPGSITFRVVNLTDAPVDAWIRTQGFVAAEPGAIGIAPGTVSDELRPPEPGEVVVLPAGEGDPVCVMDCAFLASSTTGFGDGDRRLLMVADGTATEYWEHPDPASVGAAANALPPADPAGGLLIVEASTVVDGAFGFRVSVEDANGCLADTTGATGLVGGTVVLAYPVPAGPVALWVHAPSDAACAEAPVGGPLPVDVAAGGRTMVFLAGAAGAMRAIPVVLP